MPRLSTLLRGVRRRVTTCAVSFSTSPPPSYKSIEEEIDINRQRIEASDVPQWRWSNAQCREWLIAVLVTYLNYNNTDAFDLAENLHGFGPNLYLRSVESWIKILGDDEGRGVYSILFEVRRQKGAVPKGMRMRHWK